MKTIAVRPILPEVTRYSTRFCGGSVYPPRHPAPSKAQITFSTGSFPGGR